MGSLADGYSPIIGVRVNLLKESSGEISISPVVGPFIGSETGCPLGDLLVSYPGPNIGIQLVV